MKKSFKRLYSFEWKISAQKEAFIKTLIESWGFQVKAIGIGTLSVDYNPEYESMPDFAVIYNNDIIAYIEVTGANVKIVPGLRLWIGLHKYIKYNELYRKHPIYFVYLGFNRGTLSFVKYLPIWEIDRYASKNLIEKTIRGRREKYITIPFSVWKDLRELHYEFLQVVR